MAEINDAYAALTRDDRNGARVGRAGDADGTPFEPGGGRRRGGPPPPKPTRPVTGRVDMSAHLPAAQPGRREQSPARSPLRGQPPLRPRPVGSRAAARLDADRAAGHATGSATSAGRRRPRSSERRGDVIEFGKFHGHTLGQIAAFEPSYIDWLAGTVTRDPDLVSAARVIRADLDRRGWSARARPTDDRRGRTA